MISFWLHAISYIFIQKLVSQQKLTDQLDHKMSRNNQADAYRYGTLQDDENCAINFKHGTKDAIVPSITSPVKNLIDIPANPAKILFAQHHPTATSPPKSFFFAHSPSFVDNFPPMGNNNIRIRNIDKERVPYESYRYRPPHRRPRPGGHP